ncbi:MAG: NAD(P)H-binding protein [Bifidobacteriaceae bacterium]|jgi:nucleoside-diphosphate-sugar epimerase|nr:NAD(P)H-binding protein [Bifidobacteriaceae bacterium]MCI1914333.1 NAD(P)H-binding protein [Bifidobacteriaceae bacterium]
METTQRQVLVTGGNGFLALHIVRELLGHAIAVRATVRTMERSAEVTDALASRGVSTQGLSFIEADLMSDKNWEAAMVGITDVVSVASPVFPDSGSGHSAQPSEADMAASTEGTLRILRAAAGAGVRRVVMTANFGAVGFSNRDKTSITTEENWTDENEPGLSAYEKSKLLAEKSAWKFVEDRENAGLFAPELVSINPVAILGPALGHHVSGSFGIVDSIMSGSMKRIPPIELNVVDVRDVADLHVKELEVPQAAGQRFIASAEGIISMTQIADLIRQQRPELAASISRRRLPGFAVRLGSLVSEQAREAKLLMEINRHVSTSKAQDLLGWSPRYTKEETVLAAVDSLASRNQKR